MNMYGGFGQSRFSMFPPVIKWLLGINVLLFLLGFIPVGTVEGDAVRLEWLMRFYGALWPVGSSPYMPWQYFTYMFLHGGFAHIFFNMLILWMFGMEIEQLWGSKRFLAFYIICGLGAGIIHTIITSLMGTANAPTVGASGAIMGVMIAFGMLFPDRIIFVGFFIPMRAKYAVLAFAALDLYLGFSATNDGIAHFAHVGGALVGYLMIHFGGAMTLGGIFDKLPGFKTKPRPEMQAWQPRPQPHHAGRSNVIDVEFRDLPNRQSQRQAPPRMDFGADQERIDMILDKISKTGYQNLTEEEKAILLEASKKMR